MIRYWGSKDEAHSVDTNDYFRRFGTMWTTHAMDHGPESDRILFQDGGNVGKVDAALEENLGFSDSLRMLSSRLSSLSMTIVTDSNASFRRMRRLAGTALFSLEAL